MNNKTNLLEDYVNYVDTTSKPNTYFEIIIVLPVVIKSLFFYT